MPYGFASLLGSKQSVTPSGSTSLVGGPASSTDKAIVRWNGATGTITQNSVNILTDNGDLSIPSTATLGLQVYNTSDQVTNYERVELLWATNVATFRTVKGGTGNDRDLAFTASGGATLTLFRPNGFAAGLAAITGITTTNTGARALVLSGLTSTATSGTIGGIHLSLTYNQASGTAANSDFKIARTETALGSGAQLFIECLGGAAGNTSRFTVAAATGLITHASAVLMATSVALTNGAAANAGTLTNAPAVGNPTKWVPINDNGTTRYIPCW